MKTPSLVSEMSSSSWEMQLMETAKEELEILETQYPNRFAYLKSDLQSFISHLREDHALPPASPLVDLTQGISSQYAFGHGTDDQSRQTVSITRNTRSESTPWKHLETKNHRQHQPERSNNNNKMAQAGVAKRKNRVEMVLERAHLCLQKLRDVKASLC